MSTSIVLLDRNRIGAMVCFKRDLIARLRDTSVDALVSTGVKRFSIDIETMIGSKPGSLVKLSWGFVTPLSMLAIFFFNMYNYSPVQYEEQSYPLWADCLGWAISLCSVVMVPVMALVEILSQTGTLKEVSDNNKMMVMFHPH